MAIELVATSEATQTSSTGGTLTVSVPAGTVSGDVLVVLVSVTGASTVPATPSGLTLLDSGSTGPSYASYYRVCDGTEPGSYGFTVTKRAAAIAASYSGVDNTNPINAHGAPNKVSTATATATSVTTTVNGCELVFASTVGTANETFTYPTGFVDQVLETSANNNTLVFCDESQATAGATGTITGTWSAANNNWSQIIALAPASGGTTYNDSASGSITLSGSDTEYHLVSDSPSGVIQLSGLSVESYVHSDSASGTITLSGSRIESFTYSDSPSGTIFLSGFSTDNYQPPGATYNDSGSGTITLTGSGSDSSSNTMNVSGTITITGSGFDLYQPPGSGGPLPDTHISVGIKTLHIH